MTQKHEMPFADLVEQINLRMQSVSRLAAQPREEDAQRLEAEMVLLQGLMNALSEYPREDWQNNQDAVISMTANLDTLTHTLQQRHSEVKEELDNLAKRTKMQKSYGDK